MERKTQKEIEDIFQEVGVSNKVAESGAVYDLSVLLKKCIDAKFLDDEDKTANKAIDELKVFLKEHPELTFKTQNILGKSVKGDVDLLIFVSNVLAKLEPNPEELANSVILNSTEKSKFMSEPIKLLENINDEESLEIAKKGLTVALEKRSTLNGEFVRIALDLLIKSLDKDGSLTSKSYLLDDMWKFLTKRY